ncbi:MAG TPA: hypothetical protein VH105_23690 [Burkholderiales bacterium]|jgi:hypothetical protein|nr:hypothetical protein [Burkholderiales bacterium]
MTLSLLRRLAADALAFAALALAPAAQAQALHPLPPGFLATLNAIDSSADEMAISVTAIKNADLTYSMFSRHRAEEAIARVEKQVPLLKAQTAELRREESLRVLLSMRAAFSEAQRSIGAISDTLHGVTVRTPVQADTLDKLLERLDGASARLDAALKQFDSGAVALAERATSAPAPAQAQAPAAAVPAQVGAPGAPALAQAQVSASPMGAQAAASPASVPAPGAPVQGPASPAPAQAPGLRPLPPGFLATLGAIDKSSDEMTNSVTAVKNADLTYSIFSQRRVTAVMARMDKELPLLKARTAEMRREESLGVLLSMRTAFSDAQRNIGSVSDILHNVTVRSQAQADALDRLLEQLDGASAHLDAALKQFDAAALAMIEGLDRRR